MTRDQEHHCNANARPDCPECAGKGCLLYYLDQDHTRLAPCPECFPRDRAAREALAAHFAAAAMVDADTLGEAVALARLAREGRRG